MQVGQSIFFVFSHYINPDPVLLWSNFMLSNHLIYNSIRDKKRRCFIRHVFTLTCLLSTNRIL